MKHTTVIKSPIGKLGILVEKDKLAKIDFLDDDVDCCKANDAYSRHVVNQLNAYFKNPNHAFDIEYDLTGTDYQKRIWHAINHIPAGKTLTYGELAKKMKSGPRAIGQACRTNAIPLIIPCHRIVAASSLGGFAGNIKGRFSAIKTWLLNHEKTNDTSDDITRHEIEIN